MSELTEGLDRICARFANYTPHCIRDLNPGLSLEEIEEKIQDLAFRLPPEVYELYQWHDGLSGWDFLFENYEFLPLTSAVYKYQEELKQVQADYPEIAEFFQYRFPLFENSSESGVFLTIAPGKEEGSSIYCYDIRFKDYSLRYHRLTDLILHSAEWYETAVFIEQDTEWRIMDDEAECWLNVKYMVRDHILESVHRSGGGLQTSLYQRFLDGSAALS